MFAIASGGPVFKFFPNDVTPILGCFWRNLATLICITPLFFSQIYQSRHDFKNFFGFGLWIRVIVSGIGASMWTGTFAFALYHTNLTHVYLLNNLQPIFLLVWNKLSGKPVSILALLGVLLSLLGLVFTLGSKGFDDLLSLESLLGEGIAFSGSIFAAMYIITGTEVRSKIPSFIYLFPITLISVIMYFIFTITVENTAYITLLQCFTNWEDARVVLWLCLVTGMLGTNLVAYVMKYLPSLLISVQFFCLYFHVCD